MPHSTERSTHVSLENRQQEQIISYERLMTAIEKIRRIKMQGY